MLRYRQEVADSLGSTIIVLDTWYIGTVIVIPFAYIQYTALYFKKHWIACSMVGPLAAYALIHFYTFANLPRHLAWHWPRPDHLPEFATSHLAERWLETGKGSASLVFLGFNPLHIDLFFG